MHGNNGSMDGDPPAAMRYTEARLSKIAGLMLQDIDKDTVEMALNFDDTEKEQQFYQHVFRTYSLMEQLEFLLDMLLRFQRII